MKKLFLTLLFFAICSFIAVEGVSAQETKNEVYYFKQGQQAIESGDFGAAVENFKKADELRANHPTIMQHLASACSRAEQEECTVRYLQKLGLINADLSILQDSVFHRWQDNPQYKEVRGFFEQMNEKVTTSDTAFVIPERDLHPESIAYDAQTGTFYISSIRKKKIVKKDAAGNFTPFVADGLLAASGMKIDTENNHLWLASPATQQMKGFKESDEGQSYVFKIDLESGKVIERYEADDDNAHFFGDLAIGPNGRIYVTDSIYPAVYVIDDNGQSIRLLKHFKSLRSLQGITFVPSKNEFYFADYVKGISRFDLKTERVTQIDPLPKLSLKGIDGLYFYDNSLIAVQNGVNPMRITRLYLDESGTQIKSFEYLEKNNPVLDEPTLGTIVDDMFYYVANSPWGKYNQEGELWSINKLDKGLILQINLRK